MAGGADHGPGFGAKLMMVGFGALLIVGAGTWALREYRYDCERYGRCEVINPDPPPQRDFRGTVPRPSGPTPQAPPVVQHPKSAPPAMPRAATASQPYRDGKQQYWYEKPCANPGTNPHDQSPMCFDPK